MKLSFHGAAQGVTGSCHLLESGGRRILVDCGLFQGSRELDEDNGAPFGFDPASVDCVLLTHAHLDHCGRLPLLVRRGFRGDIIATEATFELARLVLLDAAHLQEEEARRRNRHTQLHTASEPELPLYTVVNAMDCIGHFGRAVPYRQPVEIGPGVFATFFNAGHILGSASILIETRQGEVQHSVLFSGDIGTGRLLLRAPETPATAEAVVMETTYGDRQHKPLGTSLQELYEAISTTVARGGNVLIPTFALERAQEILFFLRQGVGESRLPPSLRVFLDSPMAISATEIFERHRDSFTPTVASLFNREDPFKVPGLQFTRETAESVAINSVTGGAVILAGAGMCTGGRIRHHLRHNLWRPQASVVFVGYAGAGTLGRQIIDGAKEVELFGETVPVRSQIHTINGFSAHADQNELFAWQNQIGGKRAIFLVHGEPPAMEAFAARLDAPRVMMPRLNEQVEIGSMT
jgi:metallo-beta-lactamase family protein